MQHDRDIFGPPSPLIGHDRSPSDWRASEPSATAFFGRHLLDLAKCGAVLTVCLIAVLAVAALWREAMP